MEFEFTRSESKVFPLLFQGVDDVSFRPKSNSIMFFSTMLYVDAVPLWSAVSQTLLHNGVPLKFAEKTGKPLLDNFVGCQLDRSAGSIAIVLSSPGVSVAP